METSHSETPAPSIGATEIIFFAGDDVRLAGQMDYPVQKAPERGYPLIFVIQHATSTSRQEYAHIARIGTERQMAVFRWDKRGTGHSSSGGSGSVSIDTLRAYQTAITMPNIDPERVVLFVQNEGSLLLGESFAEYDKIQHPLGVILAGNMLDEEAIMAITSPIHIITSKNDWNAWQTYAEAAADAHASHYDYPASFYVATNTNRRLMYTNGDSFHRGTEASIKHWLEHTCQIL